MNVGDRVTAMRPEATFLRCAIGDVERIICCPLTGRQEAFMMRVERFEDWIGGALARLWTGPKELVEFGVENTIQGDGPEFEG